VTAIDTGVFCLAFLEAAKRSSFAHGGSAAFAASARAMALKYSVCEMATCARERRGVVRAARCAAARGLGVRWRETCHIKKNTSLDYQVPRVIINPTRRLIPKLLFVA
jgi:hypothetical protein